LANSLPGNTEKQLIRKEVVETKPENNFLLS
jgi:hypothetical protein